MNFKFLLGISIAILIGLSVGFFTRYVANFTYANVKNFFVENGFYYEDRNIGGLQKEEEIENNQIKEEFPSSEDGTYAIQNISDVNFEIPKEGKVIVADLEQMRIQLIEDGTNIGNYHILSKGREGTSWETPPGKFEIKTKEENHFSSIGEVWMPFSMQFYGNYFIHGWPYYSNGEPVPKGYSGGCIRMSNEDMKEIYQFSDIGTKVLVKGNLINDDSNFKPGNYMFSKTDFPEITAKSYLVADIETGEVIKSKNSNKIYSIASITKLVTALTSLEYINQYLYTTVSHFALSTHGEQGNFRLGEVIVLGDLIYPLILESSNDASEIMAGFYGRDKFIEAMNDKVKSINLNNTSFEDPSGISANNKSSAEDLFSLLRYIYKYKSYLLNVSKLTEYSGDNHVWYSNSVFRNDENYLGGQEWIY